jgi:hypothetical protein
MERLTPIPADLPPRPTPPKPGTANSQNQAAEKGPRSKLPATLPPRKLRRRARSGRALSRQLQLHRNSRLDRALLQHVPEANRTCNQGNRLNKKLTLLARRLPNLRHRRQPLRALAKARNKSLKALLQRPHRPAHPALKCPLLLNLRLFRGVRSSAETRNVRPLNRPHHVPKNQEVTCLRQINLLQRSSRTPRINPQASVPKNNRMNRERRLSHAETNRARIGQMTEARVRKISRKQKKANLGNFNDHLKLGRGWKKSSPSARVRTTTRARSKNPKSLRRRNRSPSSRAATIILRTKRLLGSSLLDGGDSFQRYKPLIMCVYILFFDLRELKSQLSCRSPSDLLGRIADPDCAISLHVTVCCGNDMAFVGK